MAIKIPKSGLVKCEIDQLNVSAGQDTKDALVHEQIRDTEDVVALVRLSDVNKVEWMFSRKVFLEFWLNMGPEWMIMLINMKPGDDDDDDDDGDDDDDDGDVDEARHETPVNDDVDKIRDHGSEQESGEMDRHPNIPRCVLRIFVRLIWTFTQWLYLVVNKKLIHCWMSNMMSWGNC